MVQNLDSNNVWEAMQHLFSLWANCSWWIKLSTQWNKGCFESVHFMAKAEALGRWCTKSYDQQGRRASSIDTNDKYQKNPPFDDHNPTSHGMTLIMKMEKDTIGTFEMSKYLGKNNGENMLT